MSDHEPHTSRYDGAWVAVAALSRGVSLTPERAQEIAASVAPVLDAFSAIADELAVDDDMYEFRRLLAAEARRE
jgi:hypothetical protein